MACQVWGDARALQYRPPAGMARRARIKPIRRGRTRRDPPTRRRRRRALAGVGQKQNGRHTLSTGGQRQAARGGKIHALKLGHHKPNRARAQGFLDRPERVCQPACLNVQDIGRLMLQGAQARLQKPAMVQTKRILRDKDHRASPPACRGKAEPAERRHISKTGLTNLMDTLTPQP